MSSPAFAAPASGPPLLTPERPVAAAARAQLKPSRLAIWLAFGVIYVVWGSTFLGIRVAVQTLPPLFMAALRFLLAGGILAVFAWVRRPAGATLPTFKEWRGATIAGALFFLGNHGFVTTASKVLPSSLVCLIVATEVPIIAVLSSLLLPNQPLTRRSLIGAALGLLGVVSLFANRGDSANAWPVWACLAVLGASLSWSVGAVVSQRVTLPKDALTRAAMQMLCGGVLLTLASALKGEPASLTAAAFTPRAVGALVYLVLIGSVVAFACYTFLLAHVRTDAVATHVFVNPLVAVAVGAWLGGESMTPAHLVAGVFILASVCVITLGKRDT